LWGLAFTGAFGAVGATMEGLTGGAGAIGSVPKTEARMAARAISAAVVLAGPVRSMGEGAGDAGRGYLVLGHLVGS